MHDYSAAQEQREFTLTGDKAWQELTVGDVITITWTQRQSLRLELTEVMTSSRTFKGRTSQGHHVSGSFSPESGTGFATVS